MTDQTIPADKVREIIARHRDGASHRGGMILNDLKALLPLPTLADMTMDEQDECTGMQADLAQGDRVVILDGTPDHDGLVQVLEKSLDVYRAYPAEVTPRPDLPRLEWPGNQKPTPAPAPALPEGWRLADHKDHGRVIVTNTTPGSDGRVYYVLPSADPLGFDWLFCDPDMLTYLDQEDDTSDAAPENTLAVGSEWHDADTLAEACRESGRDQIIAIDRVGNAYVWDEMAEWWEGSAPPIFAPYTIIHSGKKADQ